MTITYIHILSKCKIKYLPRKITIFLILQKDTLRSKRKTWNTALVRILMQNEMTGFSMTPNLNVFTPQNVQDPKFLEMYYWMKRYQLLTLIHFSIIYL